METSWSRQIWLCCQKEHWAAYSALEATFLLEKKQQTKRMSSKFTLFWEPLRWECTRRMLEAHRIGVKLEEQAGAKGAQRSAAASKWWSVVAHDLVGTGPHTFSPLHLHWLFQPWEDLCLPDSPGGAPTALAHREQSSCTRGNCVEIEKCR